MSSIKRFVQGEFRAVSDRVRHGPVPLFERIADPSAATYYVEHRRGGTTRADFEEGGATSPAELQAALEALWKQGGARGIERGQGAVDANVASLAKSMAKLAAEVAQGQEQGAEVPTFIYTMW